MLDTPYIRYLEAVSDGWEEAAELKSFLSVETQQTDCLTWGDWDGELQDITAAAILDVLPDSTKNSGTLNAVASLSLLNLCGWQWQSTTTNASAANLFFEQLHSCQADTHTRIVFLQNSACFIGRQTAIINLLFRHILGIELDLQPAFVCTLAQGLSYPLYSAKLSHKRRCYLRMALERYLHLQNSDGFYATAAADLGQRKVGEIRPFVGESCADMFQRGS